jgi:signal transduction histidine kinase
MIPTRLKLALVVTVPLVAAAVPIVVDRIAARSVEERAAAVAASFEESLARAAEIARVALEESPRDAYLQPLPDTLVRRLEGAGVLDADLAWEDWIGRPADPPPHFAHAAWPAWSVRVEGALTRVVVRAGPDAEGRTGLASFVLDSTLGHLPFAELFPRRLLRGTRIEVDFQDHEAGYGHARRPGPASAGDAAPGAIPLRAPSGEILAVARLGPGEGRSLALSWALAWGTIALVAMAALVGSWRRRSETVRGLVLTLVAIGGARALLAWSWAPALLLPRSLGSPSAYGTSVAWRFLQSPADLFLTGAAVYLACAALAHHARARWGGRPVAGLVSIAAAATVTGGAFFLCLSLVRDSSVPMLDWPVPFVRDERSVAWAGFCLVLLGAAELWARAWSCLSRSGACRIRPTAVAAALVPLAAASTLVLHRGSETIALERLASEYAPEILEQDALRTTALRAALFQVRDFFESERTGDLVSRPDYLAYRFWIEGGLAHAGYKSSLDFFSPTGELVSHFDFDLPPFEDTPLAPAVAIEGPPWELTTQAETVTIGIAVEKRLLHGQVPVARAGEPLGTVVGHVLDEPENLPFLPRSRLYLAALGRGLPPETGGSISGGPEYVLYDASGTIELSTLARPPADARTLHDAARSGEPVYVTAGAEPHVGLALADDDGRLHLLLVPRSLPLEQLASGARIVSLGLLLIAISAWARAIAHRRRPADLVAWVRGSFHRRLFAWLLVPSLALLLALAVFIIGYLERRAGGWLLLSATQVVTAAQRVVEDYTALERPDAGLDDSILYWLGDVVGQDIHVYADGTLEATSKRELFRSGILPERLDGDVWRRLREEGLPYDVRTERVGPTTIPVAYARVRLGDDPDVERVVAVPLVLERQQIDRAIDRIAETIFLATLALVSVLAVAALLVARTVARPVREMVDATGRVARGDYAARLEPRTRDELAHLVSSFNAMGAEIEKQRAALEHQRDYREALLRHATTGVLSLDAEGRLVTLNPAAGALVAAAGARLGPGDHLASVARAVSPLAPLGRALARAPEGEPVEVDLDLEGEPRRVRLVRVGIEDPAGAGVGTLVLLDDVTDLMRSNQLAAWAEMARAIAHEIKNPLTPIQLSAEHLRRLLADRGVLPSSPIEACLDAIIKQVRSLHEIAGEFSAYAKLPALDPRPTDPVAFLREAVAPYRAGSPPGLVIEERYSPAPTVSIDARVLSRALVNLIENALHAMGGSGVLTVSVEADPDGSVVLGVRDTGPGLGPEVRARLFEPYFSTKSSGTGLGLAIARRAVEAHGGTIDFESAPGRGTLFRIRLPAAAERRGEPQAVAT